MEPEKKVSDKDLDLAKRYRALAAAVDKLVAARLEVEKGRTRLAEACALVDIAAFDGDNDDSEGVIFTAASNCDRLDRELQTLVTNEQNELADVQKLIDDVGAVEHKHAAETRALRPAMRWLPTSCLAGRNGLAQCWYHLADGYESGEAEQPSEVE